jgi:hypothetical protein
LYATKTNAAYGIIIDGYTWIVLFTNSTSIFKQQNQALAQQGTTTNPDLTEAHCASMSRDAFEDIEKRIPKDFVREYTTPEGGKVREIGPMVYGYSMTVGPDGKPRVREFGNVKSSGRFGGFGRPEISGETEPSRPSLWKVFYRTPSLKP